MCSKKHLLAVEPTTAAAYNREVTASLPEPSERALTRLVHVLAPLERWLDVHVEGLERLPRGHEPLMFVGNHQLLALDSTLLMAAVWRHCGVPLRPLADNFLFRVPPLGRLLGRLGVARASRTAAQALIAEQAWMLVYPGGAREATKRSGRPYELLWWDRLGFAEVALRHRCTIVPVAARGIDSAVRVVVGAERILASPLGTLLRRLHVREDMVPPLVIPKRRPHLRFHLCEPVRIDHFMGHDRETARRMLRGEVAKALQDELVAMHHRHPPAP